MDWGFGEAADSWESTSLWLCGFPAEGSSGWGGERVWSVPRLCPFLPCPGGCVSAGDWSGGDLNHSLEGGERAVKWIRAPHCGGLVRKKVWVRGLVLEGQTPSPHRLRGCSLALLPYSGGGRGLGAAGTGGQTAPESVPLHWKPWSVKKRTSNLSVHRRPQVCPGLP